MRFCSLRPPPFQRLSLSVPLLMMVNRPQAEPEGLRLSSLNAYSQVKPVDDIATVQWTPTQELGSPPSAEELGKLTCVKLSFTRSSGAGGQNVNKLSTKCEARLDLCGPCPWSADVSTRLRERATRSGAIRVTSERHRTQHANRKDALEKLAVLVAAAWHPPKQRKLYQGISEAGKCIRRDTKRRVSQKKQQRSADRRGAFEFNVLPALLRAVVLFVIVDWVPNASG